MKKIFIALAMAVSLAGCATGPSVQVMSDPQANFASYRTFGFAQPLGTDRNGYQSQVSTALMASARREMEARGFVYSAQQPQLLVNFNAALADRVRVNTVSEPTMGGGMGVGSYGYRGGLYAPYPVYQDRTTVSEYKEGTLNVDVADVVSKRLIWEGVVTKKMDSKAYENIGATIDSAVSAAFTKFPVSPRK
ncbi:MAG: DUF4136 domain-containing protein [Sphingomonadales bacterium]